MQKETIRNIESLRKKSGLSQNDLAMKMGWNQKQISRLERGERKDLDYENTELLAKALGVNIKEINPEFSNDNGDEKTLNTLLNDLKDNLPIEIPVYLQRDCGNTDSKVVYYEYSANTNSKDINKKFPAGQEGDFFAMVCETNYDWPAFSSSDLLISDKSSREKLNPILDSYIKENNISLVMDKKDLLAGSKEFDITNVIVEKLNEALPSLNLK